MGKKIKKLENGKEKEVCLWIQWVSGDRQQWYDKIELVSNAHFEVSILQDFKWCFIINLQLVSYKWCGMSEQAEFVHTDWIVWANRFVYLAFLKKILRDLYATSWRRKKIVAKALEGQRIPCPA